MPSTIGIDRWMTKLSFHFLHHFTIIFSYIWIIFSIKYSPSHHGNGQNWPHSLKFGLSPTLLPSEHHEAVVGMFLRQDIILHLFAILWSYKLIIVFQLNTCYLITGMPTDWSLDSCPHCHHAKFNRQWPVEGKGEFLFLSPFSPLFVAISQLFFSIKY